MTLAASPWPDAILQRPVPARLHVVGSTEMIPLPVERWHDHHLGEEEFLREWVCDPVLDVGCGPGRHSAALARTGRDVLGIDVSQAAVQSARRRGADALRISVFGSVPRAGQWMTVLLLDGNIGIGGDPDRLLSRVGDLLADRGSAVVELEPPGRETRQYQARVHHRGSFSPGFPWASVGAGAIRSIAAGAGFETRRVWREGSRWFGHLSKA